GNGYPKMYSGNTHYLAEGAFDFWSYWNNPQLDPAITVSVPDNRPYGCDCVTQACLLQVCLGALGISSNMVGINGFGYLSPTSLVGWQGQCNNPYFMDGSGAFGVELEDPTSVSRQSWSYHQLVQLPGEEIADATIGPHSGSESVTQYIASAVDTSP